MEGSKLERFELEQLLNKTYKNLNGLYFKASDDHWYLSEYDGVPLDVRFIERGFKQEVRPYFRLALASYATTRSGRTVLNVGAFMRMWINNENKLDILDLSHFISRKQQLGVKKEFQLSTIRGFLSFWHRSGIFGIPDSFIQSIQKLKFKGNEKGNAVKTSDPETGPYTPTELKAILDGAHNALSANKISLRQYIFLLLLAQRGFRTVQIAELKFCDFVEEGNKCFVNMPRGKQRGNSFRGQFTKFQISSDLMLSVNIHMKHTAKKLKVRANPSNLPVFPNYEEFIKNPDIECDEITEKFHANSSQFNTDLKDIQKQLGIMSERTGNALRLAASRFRRTVGSDMAREGYGVAPIARALDHEDNQNAGVYIESTPEIAERLDKKLCEYLAPLAQAFAGHIIKDETEATRRNDSTSRIRTETGQDYLGNCGSKGFCNAYAPVACYTCNRFEPWLDAPHHEVLEDKLREREEIIAITGDLTIASQIDRTILAVQNVIDRCAEIKEAATEEYDE